ncbi:MAG TPA: S41 family peptidase [Gemmatales bacterium]|nr:S41 family peptidase [Gemmatales bacterium]
MRCALSLLLALVVGFGSAAAQDPIQFARWPDISPDGRQVAFSYLGDVWIVDALGGVARAVTSHEAHDTRPHFSPDGKWLAFSSNRHGAYSVFIVPVQGGKPKRLTFDSASALVSGWTPDGKRVVFMTERPTGFPHLAELYAVPITGGREERLTAFEGRDGCFSADGQRIVYVRGPGTWYRKNYRGSASDQIWTCQADGSGNRQLTLFNGLNAAPQFSPDGKWVYYVSEHFGPANLCRIKADGSQREPEQLTFHGDADAVRRARLSGNGEFMIYEAGADLWLCTLKSSTPQCRKLAIEAYADDRTNPDALVTFTSGATEFALAPNEQQVALVVHGEIFLAPTAGSGRTKRLTDHPGHDKNVSWAPDGKKLLFVSDRSREEHIYLLEADDPEHPDLLRAHKTKVTQLTHGEVQDSDPSFAPNGKQIAFLRAGRLWTMKPDGSEAKPLVDEPLVFQYVWSPDSQWLVYSRMDGNFASEIFFVPAAGGQSTNVTRYATRNFGMTFSRDGRKMAFVSQRRNDLDVFVMNLQRPAREGESPGTGIDFDDIHLRVDRVTALSSEEYEAAIKPDGNQVVFASNMFNQPDLWMAAVNGSSMTRLTQGGQAPRQLVWARSGTIYFLDGAGNVRRQVGGVPGPASDRVAFTAKMKINRHELFQEMFEECCRKLKHRFYDDKLHGADWLAVRERYRPLVQHVTMHEDFYDLIHLMLGELNASHLGIGGRARQPDTQTAELGLLFDPTHRGRGLKIQQVLQNGPADLKGAPLAPGQFVLRIDDVEITETVNLSELLNDKVGEMVTLHVADELEAEKPRKVEVRGIARGPMAELVYQDWVRRNAQAVHDLSSGRLGYVHIRSMDMPSLDEFVRALYTENFGKEGLVIDVRYNGGGFTHDKILSYLGGREHTVFVGREGARGAVMRENDRKWTKPNILLINNRSYSDAEIFPNAFRTLGLGKLVGLPTGGYVIGTYNDTLIDGSYFRIPRLGVFTLAGVSMDKAGVQPDVIVDLHPDEVATGRDAQLAKAVEMLQVEVREWQRARQRGDVTAERRDKHGGVLPFPPGSGPAATPAPGGSKEGPG